MSVPYQFLNRVEELGLADERVLAHLRQLVAEAKGNATAEVLAKILVENGHLTPFQARKIVGEVTAELEDAKAKAARPIKSQPTMVEGLELLEEVDGLELISEGPAVPASPPPKPPPPPPGEQPALVPLPAGGLDDIFTSPLDDPLLTSATDPRQSLLRPPAKKLKNANPWDSAVIYFGGAGLAVLVFAFVVLYVSLSRGTANEAFQLAEDDFKSLAYSQAISKYEKYLSRFGEDANASLARVRIGVAQIRLAVDEGKDTAEALDVTETILQRIEPEVQFDEARAELADILPNIAERLALQAKRNLSNATVASELVAKSEHALELVNNGSYIPPSMRSAVEAKVAVIQEELSFVKREIHRDAEMTAAVAAIKEATEAGKTIEATNIHRAFLKKYPGLDAHETLVAATLAIAAKERELAQVVNETLSPAPAAESPIVEIVLADMPDAAATNVNEIVALNIDGGVYGFDASTGRLLWRYYLGLESTDQPVAVSAQPGADLIIGNRQTHDLLRLKSADGSVVWRLPISEAFARPVLVDDNLLVTTHSGKLLQIDLASGVSERHAVLPQGALQSAAYDARRTMMYQLGERSSLFVLEGDSLACRETYFLGHLPGSIATPPVAVGGQIFIALNTGADFSHVHVLSADAEGLNLKPALSPVRLKGRVVTTPIVDGRRVYVLTDLGAVQVFDVDPANVNNPVSKLAELVAIRKQPLIGYAAIADGRVWLGDERLTLHELQPARKELTRRWSRFDGEVFLTPPQRLGERLIAARRGSGGEVLVSSVKASDGATQWQTIVRVPVRAIVPEGELAVNANAMVFKLPAATQSTVTPTTARIATPGPLLSLQAAWPVDQQLCLVPNKGPARWAMIDIASQPPRVASVALADTSTLTAAASGFDNGILLPLAQGQVAFADPTTGKPLTLPFQPALSPGEASTWGKPLKLRSIPAAFAIADDRGRLFLVARKSEPQPHLAALKEVTIEGLTNRPLAQLGDTVAVVVEKKGQHYLQPFAIPDLKPQEPIALAGSVTFGPVNRGDSLLLATDGNGLECLSEAAPRWKVPLAGAGVVGVTADGDRWWIATSEGDLIQLNANGEVVGRVATKRPLGGDPVVAHDHVLCPGVDGAVYRVPQTALTPER